TGAETEIDLVMIFARATGCREQRARLSQMKPPRRWDRRPLRRLAPSFAMHAEVMHRRFFREPGFPPHQIFIEEPQQFAVEREFGRPGTAPRRHVDPRAVIPR